MFDDTVIGRAVLSRALALRLAPLAAAPLLAASLLAVPARAEEGVFIKDVLGKVGLIEQQHAPITYRERAPLVLPPKMDLPPPTADASLRNESWPREPEAVARDQRRADSKKPIVRGEQGRMSDNNTTLSVDEIRGGYRPGAAALTGPAKTQSDEGRLATWLNPLQLFGDKKDDAAPSAVEPERSALSEPPRGYRAPPGGKLERTAGEPAPNNPDRTESDPLAFVREQSRR